MPGLEEQDQEKGAQGGGRPQKTDTDVAVGGCVAGSLLPGKGTEDRRGRVVVCPASHAPALPICKNVQL